MDLKALNLLFRCNREYSHEKNRGQKLSDTECMICSFVFTNGNCSQDDVATALRIDKTTVGKALFSLERKNCVIRTRDDADRRVNRLSLTTSGRERIKGLLSVHEEWWKKVADCLSPAEQAQFESYCKRLLSAAEKQAHP